MKTEISAPVQDTVPPINVVPSLSHRVLIGMSYFTLIITSALIAYLFYLTFYPIKVVELHSFTVDNLRVKRGGTINYSLDFEKFRPYKPDVKYYLVDGIVVQLEEYGSFQEVGKHHLVRTKTIPTTILPGTYKLRIEIKYDITAWREVTYVWESKEITILP